MSHWKPRKTIINAKTLTILVDAKCGDNHLFAYQTIKLVFAIEVPK